MLAIVGMKQATIKHAALASRYAALFMHRAGFSAQLQFVENSMAMKQSPTRILVPKTLARTNT
jgi:hypothetical protein